MDDVVSDDDMFASLQKRLSGEGKEVFFFSIFASLQSVCRARARRPRSLYHSLLPSLPPSLTSFHLLPSVTYPCPDARMCILFLSASCLRFVYVASGKKIQDVEGLDGSGSGTLSLSRSLSLSLSLSLARSLARSLSLHVFACVSVSVCVCLCLSVSVCVCVCVCVCLGIHRLKETETHC
jgi:hypothetical protein